MAKAAPASVTIGFLLYPGLTQLDLTGPAQVLHRMSGAQVDFVWKTLDPVPSDCGLSLVPTRTMADTPAYDMICVPGGYACAEMMADRDVLDWLGRQGATARWITSVCTGSLILAAAGLLDGYRAGCHWAWLDQLALFGAIPVSERIVTDRNRVTGGGVTAGIDFAFEIVRQIRGADEAEALMLMLEYDPAPGARGSPGLARPETLHGVTRFLQLRLEERRALIGAIAASRKHGV